MLVSAQVIAWQKNKKLQEEQKAEKRRQQELEDKSIATIDIMADAGVAIDANVAINADAPAAPAASRP